MIPLKTIKKTIKKIQEIEILKPRTDNPILYGEWLTNNIVIRFNQSTTELKFLGYNSQQYNATCKQARITQYKITKQTKILELIQQSNNSKKTTTEGMIIKILKTFYLTNPETLDKENYFIVKKNNKKADHTDNLIAIQVKPITKDAYAQKLYAIALPILSAEKIKKDNFIYFIS